LAWCGVQHTPGDRSESLCPQAIAIVTLLCLGLAFPAGAQSLKDKIVGAWTLESGSENFPDGKKLTPWETGNLILDPTGHLAFFLIGKEQPTRVFVHLWGLFMANS